MTGKQDSFGTKQEITIEGSSYHYFSLEQLSKQVGKPLTRLPYSLKILLENLLRHEDGRTVNKEDIMAIVEWLDAQRSSKEIAYRPARVLMQDFTGVPAVVDLAAMRDAVVQLGGDPSLINPLASVDLVIDHSVQVDSFGNNQAFEVNVSKEMERNHERYSFLRWGQEAFQNFRVVPPGTGICHQVNLEYLAKVVWQRDEDGIKLLYPDTLVGTDSHTTMINGLAVLGWGVGGIEAEAAILGQPISMLIPEVIGVKLTGRLKEGTTATDVVLTVTNRLREYGVVGKFVEFFGSGLDDLQLADRATIANMSPEYGATCGIFPIDQQVLHYLKLSGRDEETIAIVEAYAKAQGMWRSSDSEDPIFTDVVELDLSTVTPSIAGPKRPQDKVVLDQASAAFHQYITEAEKIEDASKQASVPNKDYTLGHGDIVIAAITSCTNTSNPDVMIGAGLVAKKALEKGLQVKPWVKSSLAPGSKVVTEYLEASGLQTELDQLGFNLVGYGCTTCIGNSGPLDADIEETIKTESLAVASVLSGNRNFEGRVHPLTRANYLMSPPLVVAYALAGSMHIDLTKDPIAENAEGENIYLKDIWPTNDEIAAYVGKAVTSEMFTQKYADVFSGDQHWKQIEVSESVIYPWSDTSSYVKHPPYFKEMTMELPTLHDVTQANILALLGDSITTDHISPAGAIAEQSPAGRYLSELGIERKDFNSYGSRRGNHEVMMRGTFGNIRIKNEMTPEQEGGVTRYIPTGEVMSIYDAAMKYQEEKKALVVIGGKEYGTGSSRDWAAKGTLLLGVKAVIVESFERIHRSNLVGMGVMPLEFEQGTTRHTLKLTGNEQIDITGLTGEITPRMTLECTITYEDGATKTIPLLFRLDTEDDVAYFKHGGILQYVMRDIIQDNI